MKELLIKELKRKKQEEDNYQIQLTTPDNTTFKTSTNYHDLANELIYSDGKIQQIEDIIFFLETDCEYWEDELEHKIQVVRAHH